MISRVAESCFWLSRYVERADDMARIASVNRAFVLDVDIPAHEQWWPIVVVVGEQERIREHLPEEALLDGERVLEYLTWSQDNPVSIASSIHWARENARTIRETISLEMWESLNAFFHWLGGEGRVMHHDDPDAFYDSVRGEAAAFQGIAQSTMLHEEPYDFMRLGMLLERAGWTARTLDVKHHRIGFDGHGTHETPVEAAHTMALLHSCSATDPFFRCVQGAATGRRVVEFLIEAESFPRSVLHCLDRAYRFLGRVRPESGTTGQRSGNLLRALVQDLRALSVDDLFERGLHDELTRIIDTTSEVCQAVHDDYFAPDAQVPAVSVRPEAG